MRRVLMVRHGETDWNVANRWQGWIDIPLNQRGVQQAQAKAAELSNTNCQFAAVASSDLSRAHETATVLKSILGIDTHFVHEGFRERFGGDWQGLTRTEIHATWPEQVELWRSGQLAGPPNAETTEAMLARFDVALACLADAVPQGDLALVTHGGIQRAVATRAGGSLEGVLENLGSMWFQLNATCLVACADTASAVISNQSLVPE